MYLSSFLTDQLLCLLSVFLLFRGVDNGGIGTFHGVKNCYGSADTAVSSGDESFLTSKFASCFVGLIPSIVCGKLIIDGIWTSQLVLFARRILMRDRGLMTLRLLGFDRRQNLDS